MFLTMMILPTMGNRQPTCPKCANKLVWNGTTMCCISCTYLAPADPTKSKSEKKLPTPRKK